jgi:tight adherence protein B
MYDDILFLVLVFITTFLAIIFLLGPGFGASGVSRRRMRERLREVAADSQAKKHLSLIRERYLRELSPWERRLMDLPGMDALQTLVEQAGSKWLSHWVAIGGFGIALGAGALLWHQSGIWFAFLPGATFGFAVPIVLLKRQRAKRLLRFEEQLGDALTIASRSMRAGMPFTESLNLISQEMPAPLGKEFALVYTEINYGGDVRAALMGLLERVPSITVTALVSSVMIQRDTGGNLAEVMDKLAGSVRERFRFQRNLRTLSADGRMQGKIMTALPFVITGYMQLTQPEKLAMMMDDPTGRKLITWALIMMGLGILWIRRIVRQEI